MANTPHGTAAGAGAFGSGEAHSGRFDHVVVCLDRSELSENAFHVALSLALSCQANLKLVHVLNEAPDMAHVHATDALEWEIVRDDAVEYLGTLARRAAESGVETSVELARGSTPHAIAELVDAFDAGVLVVSTAGAGGVTDAWPLGGTVQKILALSRAPVLVAPCRADEPARVHVPPRRILVPLDGALRSECVLPTALYLARTNRADIVVAHVVPHPIRSEILSTEDDLTLAYELADRLGSSATTYLERVRSRLAAGDVPVRVSISRASDLRQGFLDVAVAEEVDMVIASAHGAGCNPQQRFGSLTAHMVACSPVPALVIQDLPARGGARARAGRLPSRCAVSGDV